MKELPTNVVLIFASCIAVALSDQQCTSLNGACQYTSNSCTGSYQSGLCNGPADRKCCLPNDPRCIALWGECQQTSVVACQDGSYVSNKCNGPNDRKCCVPDFDDSQCTALNGACQSTSITCQGGNYVIGKCGGPTSRHCCVPDFDDSQCTALNGACQSTSITCQGGNYVIGKCGGPTNRRCCVPESSCEGVTIVSRADWGARAPSHTLSDITGNVGLVFIHHTVSSPCSSDSTCQSRVRGIQNYHMDTRNYNDIGYSFLVGGNGKIYEGRGWDKEGAHTQGYNSRSVAISFIGNFQSQSPTVGALNAAKDLIACGVSQGKLTSNYALYGHRQASGASTACPGDTLFSIIGSWAHFQTGTAPP